MITTQAALRAAFWQAHPDADRRLIKNYAGDGKMYCTDTRVAWVDYVDHMQRDGQISEGLAERATLQPTPMKKVYRIVGNYAHGAEVVDTFDTRKEARAMLTEYNMAHRVNHSIKVGREAR